MEKFTALEWLIIPHAILNRILAATSHQLSVIWKIIIETILRRLLATTLVYSVIGFTAKESDFTEHFFQGEVMISTPESVK